MVPAQIEGFIRFGNILALDLQNKLKNTYGWNGCFPAAWNGNNKLQNFADSLMLQEDDRWYAWIAEKMCVISGRPIQYIQIIACDGGPSPANIKSYLPRKCNVQL